MKLDCDPTTIYAAILDNRYRGTIYRSDLDSENPYNTYRHAGLPPGPIANPGMASIQAVLHPADSDALYFVLRPDGSGAHQFSSIRPTTTRPPRSIIVDSKKSVKQHLREILAAETPSAITETVWRGLLWRLAPVSESYLRELLRGAGLPIDQPYAGIRQHTFEELEESLCAMLQVYLEGDGGGEP